MIHIVCRLAFVERVCHFVLNFSTCRLQSSQNQSLSLHVWITWSLFTLLAALGPHHLLLDSQHHPCYKSQVAPFNMHYFVSRNNSPNSFHESFYFWLALSCRYHVIFPVDSCSRQITMPVPHHSVFTGRMPFLPPNQQRQSTEGEKMICIWSSWYHSHHIISCSSKIQNGLPFWCWLSWKKGR